MYGSITRSGFLAFAGLLVILGNAVADERQSIGTIERGKYLATAADCTACHTRSGGKLFAGGVNLQTPFGRLVGANITPNPVAGIGDWTDDEFVSALRDGRGRGGKRLLSGDAVSCLYEDDTGRCTGNSRIFAVNRTDARQARIQSTAVSVQHSVGNGRVEYDHFQPGQEAADPSKSGQWNRGHYLVDAIGHCGACHTPKNIMGADKRSSYLQGGLLQGWYAPNITGETRRGIGEWSIEELVAYLKTGANTYTVASGGMGEEVVHSSSHMTEADLDAVAVYLLSVKPAVRQSPLPLEATDPRMTAGQALYKDICAPCHTDAGTGAARLFPRLAGSPAVHADDPTTLIRTVLYGSRAAATDGAPTGPMMPSFFWRLGDAQVAAVITYIRNAWGNAASPVSTHQVREIKSEPSAG